MLVDRAQTNSDAGGAQLSPAARRNLLLLGLTWSAGFVDAISFLGLGNVFTANMTGNTMLLGIALGRGNLAAALRSSIALAGFSIGAIAGALIVNRGDRDVQWPSSVTMAVATEFVALAALALGWCWGGAFGLVNLRSTEFLIALSAFAMGVQSAAVRQIGVSAVTSTAVTGTLAGVMAGAVGWLHTSVGVPHSEHPRTANAGTGFGLSASVWGIYALGGLAGGALQLRWQDACAWPAVVVIGVVVTTAVVWQPSSRELPAS